MPAPAPAPAAAAALLQHQLMLLQHQLPLGQHGHGGLLMMPLVGIAQPQMGGGGGGHVAGDPSHWPLALRPGNLHIGEAPVSHLPRQMKLPGY